MWIYVKLCLTAIFWGGTFIAGRFLAAGQVEPFAAAFLRFAVASVCLVGLSLLRAEPLGPLRPGQCWGVVLLGVTGVFAYNVFFFRGLALIDAGRASLIIACNPVLISVMAACIFGERLGPTRLAGTLVSVAGALVVITRGAPHQLLSGGIGRGEVMIFGCVASWVAYSLIGRTVLRGIGPLVTVTGAALVGTLLLMPAALAEGMATHWGGYRWQDWGCLAYLGIFGTVLGFVWYYQGIAAIGPGRASLFINFVPVSAIALAWLILDEPLTPSLLAGALMVGAGVYLTNRLPAAPGGRDPAKAPVKGIAVP
jgi:drug/metabolite transporter (DMT)-like permease